MTVNSRVNPNFPLPGLDQPTKGFRDNFTIIKQEIEALQGKQIQLTGDITGGPVVLGTGTTVVQIVTTSKVYRQTFQTADVSGGELIITHNLGNKIVLVQVSDNLDQVIQPDAVTLLSTTQVRISLTSFVPFTGTWNVIVRG
jgi:aspartate carbamoyltransferase catalytic subunit